MLRSPDLDLRWRVLPLFCLSVAAAGCSSGELGESAQPPATGSEPMASQAHGSATRRIHDLLWRPAQPLRPDLRPRFVRKRAGERRPVAGLLHGDAPRHVAGHRRPAGQPGTGVGDRVSPYRFPAAEGPGVLGRLHRKSSSSSTFPANASPSRHLRFTASSTAITSSSRSCNIWNYPRQAPPLSNCATGSWTPTTPSLRPTASATSPITGATTGISSGKARRRRSWRSSPGTAVPRAPSVRSACTTTWVRVISAAPWKRDSGAASASASSLRPIPTPGTPAATVTAACAVLARALTRDDIWDAIRSRRVYATTGANILLDFQVNGAHMGEIVVDEESGERSIYVAVGA